MGVKERVTTSQISGKEESQQEEHGALLTPQASFRRTALVATGTWNRYNLTWNEYRASQPRMTSSGELSNLTPKDSDSAALRKGSWEQVRRGMGLPHNAQLLRALGSHVS